MLARANGHRCWGSHHFRSSWLGLWRCSTTMVCIILRSRIWWSWCCLWHSCWRYDERPPGKSPSPALRNLIGRYTQHLFTLHHLTSLHFTSPHFTCCNDCSQKNKNKKRSVDGFHFFHLLLWDGTDGMLHADLRRRVDMPINCQSLQSLFFVRRRNE